jgi:3-hydroxy-D-aspartate aldolase
MAAASDEFEVGYDVAAAIGASIEDIETPALIVDLDAFERNCERMRGYAETMGVRLRAHAKTHKSADIARYQMTHGGACGICCQKVSEAEALVRAGITDILIANEVSGRRKIERVARLAKAARILVCVDNAENVGELSAAAVANDITIEVLVEIDCGARRCGTQPGEPALDLARRVAAADNLVFAGLQAYNGPAQHIEDPVDRRAAIRRSTELARETVELFKANGFECNIVGGAGTGTHYLEGESGIYNELQAGSYIFMDAHYGRVRGEDNQQVGGFEHALFVLASVMSKPEPRRAVCDAGLKAHSIDSGLPIVFEASDLTYVSASDEHGVIDDPNNRLGLNSKVKLIPGHCDPTCNLHDWFIGVRNGRVEAVWPVTARGKLY